MCASLRVRLQARILIAHLQPALTGSARSDLSGKLGDLNVRKYTARDFLC